MNRNGWASGQLGNVLVENRECTTASGRLDALVDQVGEEAGRAGRSSACPCRRGCATTATGSTTSVSCSARLRRQNAVPLERHARARACRRRRRRAGRRSASPRARWRRAARRRPGPRASRGPRGPPRRRSPRCAGGSWRPARRRRAGRRCRRRTRVGGGRSKSTTARRKRVGDLEQDAGAVTRVGLGAHGAAVLEVAQRGERLGHDVVAGHAGQGGDEGDTARVVLVAAVVEPLGRRERSHLAFPVVVCAHERATYWHCTWSGAGLSVGAARGRRWPKMLRKAITERPPDEMAVSGAGQAATAVVSPGEGGRVERPSVTMSCAGSVRRRWRVRAWIRIRAKACRR